MDFIHGLAVILIIFEGNIIKCKGTAPGDKNSANLIQDAPIIEIKGDQPLLPDDLTEVIVSRTDFGTAKTAIRRGIIKVTNTVMSSILKNRIIMITPHEFDGRTYEYNKDGDLFLTFGSYRGLLSFFDKFGDQVKRIKIDYDDMVRRVQPTEIKQTIIKIYLRCAKNLEELRISTLDDRGIWEEGITFPKVKKLKISGRISRKKFNMNIIFPNLESFNLFGSVNDTNCLTNVTTLKELKLITDSIEEHQLDHIFANNEDMTRICLQQPLEAETLQAIVKNLKKLETLEVRFPAENFWFRSNNRELFNLPSVTCLRISFFEIIEIIGDLSFDMPHLKKLHLDGTVMDNEIVDFVNHFKELETVELLVDDYDPVECIKQLKHIKEFMAKNFEDSQLNSLRKMFEHFDETSKLQTLKLVDCEDYKIQESYEETMRGINIHLARSNKPTWILSQGQQKKKGRKYLIFKREL